MHYAIGDVHGCFDALTRLLDAIDYDSSHDVLWFVGDLVNRGPDSLAVMEFVTTLPDSTILILGNHDLHFLAVAHGLVAANPKDTLEDLLAVSHQRFIEFFLKAKLFHYDASLDFAIVHAGIPPQWDLPMTQAYAHEVELILQQDPKGFLRHMYGDQPEQWNDTLQGWDRYRVITNYLTRMRFCDPSGRLDLKSKAALGTQPPGYLPWFEYPRLFNSPIIFGHWAALQGQCHAKNCFAIDGGCVWGGHLQALCLETKVRTSVPSTR